MSEIRRHGNLEQLVKDEARRFGWEAKVSDVDVDPLYLVCGEPKPAPGRGTVTLSRGETGAIVPWEYELPEDEDDIRAQVRAIIRADQQEVDRRLNPDRAARPIEVR